jgi:phosphoglycerate dehydrogenase-like enzyme
MGVTDWSRGAPCKIVLRTAFPEAGVARLQAVMPAGQIVTCPRDAGLMEEIGDAEILIGGLALTPHMLSRAVKLRWVQSLRAGIEGFVDPDIVARGIVVTNGRGINAATVTSGTRHILNRTVPAKMRPSAFVYNFGRGGLIDHDALCDALRQGGLASAGLDVADPGPLAVGSLLWRMPNVVLTGHTAAISPGSMNRALEFFEDNRSRYREGRRSRNLVDALEAY